MTPSSRGTGPLPRLLLAAALVLLLSVTWLLVKVALSGAPIGMTSAGRVGFTVISLWGLLRLMRRRAQGDHGDTAPRALPLRETALLSLTGVVGYTAFSTMSIAAAGPVLPALVMSTGPLVVLLATAVRERRLPGIVVLLGTVTAVAGTMVFLLAGSLTGTGDSPVLGVLLALGAVGCMTYYTIRFAALTRDHQGSMIPVILPIYAFGVSPLLVWALVEALLGAILSPTALLALFVLGVVVYVPVYLLQHRLLAREGASFVSLLGLAVSPLVAVEVGLLGLGAWPGLGQWIAIGVTVIGMSLVLSRQAAGRG